MYRLRDKLAEWRERAYARMPWTDVKPFDEWELF